MTAVPDRVEDELEPLITRCPKCSTQFRVTENQLAVASGRVRCGACLTVFQGIDHLVLDDEDLFASDGEADAALDELLDELEPGERFELEIGTPAPASSRGSAPEAVPAAASLQPPASTPQIARRLFGGFEEDGDTREVRAVRVGWDEGPSGPPAAVIAAMQPVAPTMEEAPEPATIGDTAVTADEDYRRWLGRDQDRIDALVEEVVTSGRVVPKALPDVREDEPEHAPVEAEPDPVLEAVPDAVPDPVPEAVLEDAQPRPQISFAPEPRRWWVGVLAALFVILFVLQVAYLQLPEWSREPSLRPGYELACGWLGCELPEMRALDALRTRNLVVRSHPDTQGGLVVDASIVNVAPFAQRFPDLELRFTSATGEIVAGRRFSPDEYLPKDFEGERSMPPDTPIQLSLEIVDPGPDAVNYTLSFR